jgi:S-adenosylmethionine hydrolase
MSKMNKKNIGKIITLLTDFGTEDGYVGAMKGVILNGLPDGHLIDISHDIRPFDVHQAAYVLNNYAAYYPEGTIHIVVVDPGVGTHREGLVLHSNGRYFIGPNNGVFSYIYHNVDYNAWRIKEQKLTSPVSPTFHGRDVFAPAAVRIGRGETPESFCQPFTKLFSFIESPEQLAEGDYRLKIIHIDHFGNLILNFTKEDWKTLGSPENIRVQINHSFVAGIKQTFGDVKEMELLITWDSQDFLQIAQNQGNAAKLLNKNPGDTVQMTIPKSLAK